MPRPRPTRASRKGVKIAGYGRENLRIVPVDADFAMDPAALERAVDADEKAGFVPACVVATVGTTSSGAVDPLAAIGKVARDHGMWFHVDAAYAGTAALLPEKRRVLDGVELADSFVFNPHKWMLTNFDCSAYFVRDAGALVRTFEIHPEYLKTGVDAQVNNYRDWGIQLGRRFRALKLWFVLRSYGVEGIRAMVREHLRLAGLFKGWVEEPPAVRAPGARALQPRLLPFQRRAPRGRARRPEPAASRARQRLRPGLPDPYDAPRKISRSGWSWASGRPPSGTCAKPGTSSAPRPRS